MKARTLALMMTLSIQLVPRSSLAQLPWGEQPIELPEPPPRLSVFPPPWSYRASDIPVGVQIAHGRGQISAIANDVPFWMMADGTLVLALDGIRSGPRKTVGKELSPSMLYTRSDRINLFAYAVGRPPGAVFPIPNANGISEASAQPEARPNYPQYRVAYALAEDAARQGVPVVLVAYSNGVALLPFLLPQLSDKASSNVILLTMVNPNISAGERAMLAEILTARKLPTDIIHRAQDAALVASGHSQIGANVDFRTWVAVHPELFHYYTDGDFKGYGLGGLALRAPIPWNGSPPIRGNRRWTPVHSLEELSSFPWPAGFPGTAHARPRPAGSANPLARMLAPLLLLGADSLPAVLFPNSGSQGGGVSRGTTTTTGSVSQTQTDTTTTTTTATQTGTVGAIATASAVGAAAN